MLESILFIFIMMMLFSFIVSSIILPFVAAVYIIWQFFNSR